MKNNKKVGVKNYIIVFLIVLVTVIISFYILSWYRQYNKNVLEIPVISDSLSVIKYNELDEVVQDRDFLILYACTSSESKCRSFESKLKTYVNERDLSDDIVYFNLGYSKDNGNYIDKIYNTYKSDRLLKKINGYPVFMVFNEGKIIDILSSSNEKVISITDLDEFLEGYDLK